MTNCSSPEVITDPASTEELLGSERKFISAMHQLGFGRFERLLIRRGELVLNPWPTMVREWKFAANPSSTPEPRTNDFELKRQLREFIQFVRSIESGEIRQLDIRHGLPFSMELDAGQSERRPVAPVEKAGTDGARPLATSL